MNKILFIAPHLSTGGMPAFLLKRIESLKDKFDIYVYEHEYYGEDFVVHRNKIKELVGVNRFFSGTPFMDIIYHYGIDIVHLDEMPELMNNQDLFKELYSNDRTWRIVETCHNVSFNPDTQKIFQPDLYIFCSPFHEDVFAEMDSLYDTIQFPIDDKSSSSDAQKFAARKLLGFDNDKKHVINVGLWTSGKNQGEGIEIARKYPDMMFHFIGNQAGNFSEYWEPLMQNLPNNVKVWGERSDTDKFFLAADIFMFNSTWECNPLVLREAISYGLPIIAHDLKEYIGMFKGYLNSIDTDLNTLKFTYKIPTDNTTKVFADRHEFVYNTLLTRKINKQKISITHYFIDEPFVEIKGISDSYFTIRFYDEDGICHYENTIQSNHWVKLNRTYYTKWTLKVWENDELIYEYILDLKDKRVAITLESSSLGDTLAWLPAAIEFQKKHECELIVSTFMNHLFDYPNITFVEPGSVIPNLYALYRLGYDYNLDKEPVMPNTVPLQKNAFNILGLDYVETRPILSYKSDVVPSGKYVTIATNSTAACKFWTKDGWQFVVDFLVSRGYKVYNVSKEENYLENCTQITTPSLESKMKWIDGSEFFIGLSSGLSWLAWAMKKKVIMISNFTEDWNEFELDCIRVTNKSVCHGCWNNTNYRFDKGDYWWCPVHKGTPRQFECHTSIKAIDVIHEILQLTLSY